MYIRRGEILFCLGVFLFRLGESRRVILHHWDVCILMVEDCFVRLLLDVYFDVLSLTGSFRDTVFLHKIT